MKRFLVLLAMAGTCFAQVPPPPPASQAEVNAGLVKTKYVSPFTLHGWTGSTNSSGGGAGNTNSYMLKTNGQAYGTMVSHGTAGGSSFSLTGGTFQWTEPGFGANNQVTGQGPYMQFATDIVFGYGVYVNGTSGGYIEGQFNVVNGNGTTTIDGGNITASGTITAHNGLFYTNNLSNPNSVLSAQAPAIFYNSLGAQWYKTNTGYNNVGWDCVVTNR